MKRPPSYLRAEIHADSLRSGELMDLEGHDPVQVWWRTRDYHAPFVFLRRRDVARLIFAGQRERLRAYRAGEYISETVRLSDAAERRAG